MTVRQQSSQTGHAPQDRSSDAFEFVIENMRQGLWRLDSFGRITYANPYLAEWLELTSEELIGQHFSRFRNLRMIASGKVDDALSQRYEAEFNTKTGIVRRAIVVTSPAVDSAGNLIGTIDLITDITAEHAVRAKLAEEVQHISELASTDSVTGIANRFSFDKTLQSLMEAAAQQPFGLIIVDLDYFKNINDTHGHEWGDAVLREVAHRIKSVVRDHDIVARFGGDEFAILLPNVHRSAVEEVEARLKENVRFTMAGNGRPIRVSVSVGLSHSSEDIGSILNTADQNMYRVKRARHANLV